MSAATRDMEWDIQLQPQSFQRVRGFLDVRNERNHVHWHFLAAIERWDELGPQRRTVEWRDELGALTPDSEAWTAKMAATARDYVGVVRQRTKPLDVIEAEVGSYERQATNSSRYLALWVVSRWGMFIVFAVREGAPWHLTTAMRPFPKVHRGVPRGPDFLQAARRKFNALVSR